MYKILILLLIVSLSVSAQDKSKVVFSLSEAQDYALQNNQTVQNARLDILLADKKVWETTAIGLPQVSGTFTHNYFIDLPVTLIPAKIFNPDAPDGEYMELKFGTDHSTKLNLQATQIIFSGEYLVGLQASRIFKSLSENQLEKTEQDIKKTVSNTYQLILIAQERRALIEQNIKSTKSLFSDTKAMYEAGFAEATDVDQLQITISTLNNALSSVTRQIDLIKNLLKFQLNIPLEKEISLSDNLEALLSNVEFLKLTATNFNKKQHIDFRMIQTQEQVKLLNVKREKAAFLPTFSAFYSHQQSLMSNDFEVFSGGKWHPANIIGLNINVPIFSSGQRLSRVSQAKIELEKTRNSLTQVSQSLSIQVLKAKTELQNSYENYMVQKENKKLSEKIFNNYQTKYKNGMASSLELTQSQMQHISAQDAYLQAVSSLLDAKDNFSIALGILE
jgi:outer membrane protein TolC